MTTVLSTKHAKRIARVIRETNRRLHGLAEEAQHTLEARKQRNQLSRRYVLADEARRRYQFERQLARGLIGLKVLLKLGKSKPIQDILTLEERLLLSRTGDQYGTKVFSEFCFYLQVSARHDAPDQVAVYLRRDGIALWAGCPAADDYQEIELFPYTATDDELKELLSNIVAHHPTTEAFALLDPGFTPHLEWSSPQRDIGFQVFVDCGEPDKLERYIDWALNNYRPDQTAA